MQVKSKTAYSEVFQRILEEEPVWNPSTLYAGTDEGLVAGIQDVFPNCNIISCWFHFAQVCFAGFENYLCNETLTLFNSNVYF